MNVGSAYIRIYGFARGRQSAEGGVMEISKQNKDHDVSANIILLYGIAVLAYVTVAVL